MRTRRRRASSLIACAGAVLACAVGAAPADATLLGFGENEWGELGSEVNNLTQKPNPAPAPVSLPGATGPVVSAAMGEVASLVITSTGQLYTFGSNDLGELGFATNKTPNPTPTLVTLPGATGPAAAVAGGGFFSLAATTTGQLYGFGVNNQAGQLGTPVEKEETRPTPTLISLPGATGPVTEVAAGATSGYALTSTGQVFAWGENGSGQVGVETNVETFKGVSPTRVPIAEQVTKLVAGGADAYALTKGGVLYGWGNNAYGQLGNTTNNKTNNANPNPAPIAVPGTITDVAADGLHTLVLTSSGLYAFGANDEGQIGNAGNVGNHEPNPTPTQVTIPGLVGSITKIATGREDSLVVTSSGQLFSFGLNFYGELGFAANAATVKPNPAPTQVSLPPGFKPESLGAGPSATHTLVIGSEGVTVTADGPVAEPRTGSVPETFTVTLPKTEGSAVTVHYQTLDGTAKASANAYTPIADGFVTIPAGQTSAQITVQVDNGSGQAEAASEEFQVKLTSSSGPQIGADTAPGLITIPGIEGKLTDHDGNPQASHRVVLTGTAASGQSVERHVLTDGGGRYSLYADPGTYSLTPDPPVGQPASPHFEPVECPGTVRAGACAEIALEPAARLVIDFKLDPLIVNSAANEDDPEVSLRHGVCDTTPTADSQRCTLRAAIETADKLARPVTIEFEIPEPSGAMPVIEAPEGVGVDHFASIEGASQPGSHRVEITTPPGTGSCTTGPSLHAGACAGLALAGGKLAVRGLVMRGFPVDIEIGGLTSTATGQAIYGEPANPSTAFPSPGSGPAADVVQGDDLRPAPGVALTVPIQAGPQRIDQFGFRAGVLLMGTSGAQVGGAASGQGNTLGEHLEVLTEGEIKVVGAGVAGRGAAATLMQGNTVGGVHLVGGHANTIGGSTPAAGNKLGQTSLQLYSEEGDVVQGNTLLQADVRGSRNTIGAVAPLTGSAPGNTFTGSGSGVAVIVAPATDVRGAVAEGNVVQGNRIDGYEVGVDVRGARHTTIGGASPGAGNTIGGVHTTAAAGIELEDGFGHPLPGGQLGCAGADGPASQTTVSHNAITGFTSGYGVLVRAAEPKAASCSGIGPISAADEPVADTITGNEMGANQLGIGLGSQFHFNGLNPFHEAEGPNHLQPYPPILSAVERRGATVVTLKLAAPRGDYSIELYSQSSCAADSVTHGQGVRSLGHRAMSVGLIESQATLSFAAARGAVTATATSADGSTSEFSTCLTIGHSAPSIAHRGVRLAPAVEARPTGAHPSRATAGVTATTLIAALHPFCPPSATRFCAGTVALRGGSRAVLSFKLAPDAVGSLSLRLPASVATLLRRHHTARLSVTIRAHDGSRRPRGRTVTQTVTIRLAR